MLVCVCDVARLSNLTAVAAGALLPSFGASEGADGRADDAACDAEGIRGWNKGADGRSPPALVLPPGALMDDKSA